MKMKHVNAKYLVAMADGKTIQARYLHLKDRDDEFDYWFDISDDTEVSFNAVEQLVLGFATTKRTALEFRIKEK